MSKKENSVAKVVLSVILAIVMCVCSAIIGWFLYVKFYAPTKIVANTYEVGLQELKDGTTKSFIEVRYHTNENKNGLECLDIKFNYLLDESQEAFYSQGLQIVTNKVTQALEWNYYLDEKSQYITTHEGNVWNFQNDITRYGYFGSYNVNEEINAIYNYSSENDYKDVNLSTLPINDNSTFRIQLGDDLYLMKFKGTTTKYHTEENLYGSEYLGSNWLGNKAYKDYYFYNNIYAFAEKLYEALQGITNGQKSSRVFEFGNMFDYYKFDVEKGQYSDTAVENSTKIVGLMKSYYSIYVEKNADGVRLASDSLFNSVQGSTTFNLTGDKEVNDYFVGRSVIKCNIFDFNLIEMENGYCALKLSTGFVNEHLKYKDKSCLSICIDKDILKQKNINNFVFAVDSGLENFDIFECYTLETVNGETVRVEVSV